MKQAVFALAELVDAAAAEAEAEDAVHRLPVWRESASDEALAALALDAVPVEQAPSYAASMAAILMAQIFEVFMGIPSRRFIVAIGHNDQLS